MIRRREFITLLGGAAAWPVAASAQQPAMPVVGILAVNSAEANALRMRAFREALSAAGYVDGQNVQIKYRWAEAHRLPELASQLAQDQVAVLVAAGGTASALAAKAATATIPIVFAVAVDPVSIGLVPSLNRPGGNLTGVTNLNVDMGPKRLELLRQLIPKAKIIALLINPTNPALADPYMETTKAAASGLGLQLQILQARNDREIESAFSSLMADAVLVAPDVFFTSRTEQLAALSLRYKVPTIYQYRPFPAAGGLVSYGSDEREYYYLVGVYAGRILKGDKPADLPVQRSTKVELIINLKTAKTLGINVPLDLIGRADEIIE